MQQEEPAQQPQDSLVVKKPQSKKTKSNRTKYNQLLYQLFVRQNEFGETHEFCNYIKGLTLRMQGNISQSVESLKKCLIMNDKNQEVLKYISKNLFFMGRYKASIEVALEALRLGDDWELLYTLGQSYMALKDLQRALQYFQKSFDISKNEQTFMQMGRLYTIQENFNEAINIYKQALTASSQNSEIMTVLGILYLRIGENQEALKYLEDSNNIEPKDQRSIFKTIGLASILQDKSDYDAALVKYRQLLVLNPNSCQVWNNIGMSFYGKKKYIAAISCLKKALYFDSFEWIVHFNLGLVHLTTQQYPSAFHFFSAAISLKPDYAQSYMYLGISLYNLEDYQNCFRAMDRALQLEKDYIIYLNYCIVLLQRGQENVQRAKDFFKEFEIQYLKIDEDTRCNREEITTLRSKVAYLLGIPIAKE